MALDPTALPAAATTFLTERHLATLTTMRPDNTPHVVAVGFTWDPDSQLVRIITFAGSRKARNVVARPGSPAAVCQVDGGRWLTLEGTAEVTSEPAGVADGVRRYAERYRQPGEREDRVVIEIAVTRILGRP
ncbi:MAG TPA: PPOX class F420-dependent oxidoreductase [Acidimicrobiales bacterium]